MSSNTTFNTLRIMQKNVQQVHPNFWTLKLDGSHKTISNIVKVAPGDYRVTLNSLSCKTFMKALASLISVYEETLFKVNFCKETSAYDAPHPDTVSVIETNNKLMKVAKMIKKSVVAVVVSVGIFGGVAHANTLDTDTAVFLSDVNEMGTHNTSVINEWNSLTYSEQQDAYTAKPSLKVELDAQPKTEPVYTTDGQHPTNERHQQPLVGTPSHLDGTHWTQTPGITKESNPAGNPTNQIGTPSHLGASDADRQAAELAKHNADVQHAIVQGQVAANQQGLKQARADESAAILAGQKAGQAAQDARLAAQAQSTGAHLTVEAAKRAQQQVDALAQAQAQHQVDENNHQIFEATQANATHLDGNVTDAQRQAAKDQAMIEHIQSQVHDGKDGVSITGKQGVAGKDGLSITGKPGKDGITKVDTKTQQQVSRNSGNIQLMQGEVISESHSRYNGDVAAVKSANSYTDQRIKSVEDQQSNDRKEYRAGIAGAVAISGLHYVDTDNSVAIGAGSFKDAQGYSMGYRHKFAENVAATVAASETSNGDAVFAASAAVGW